MSLDLNFCQSLNTTGRLKPGENSDCDFPLAIVEVILTCSTGRQVSTSLTLTSSSVKKIGKGCVKQQ